MKKFDELASDESIHKTKVALEAHNIEVMVVGTAAEALEMIKELIPAGATVMNGTSRTLEQIRYSDYLATGAHPWVDLHAKVTAENDAAKRAELRKAGVTAEYYLGSVHALAETGEFIVASNTGSQLPHLAFTSTNLILVVGAQKIVPDLPTAMLRLEEYVVPLEDKRMQEAYGVGTRISKLLIFKYENPTVKRKVRLMIVKEKLGF